MLSSLSVRTHTYKRYVFFLFLLVFTSFQLPGQTLSDSLPQVIPPSPTVANLMHFEEVPIDYYSGQPDISLPIFSKKVYKGLNVNIGLKYSTMGVRIDERSGWTGTGWSLQAGGTISRTVRGIPDETNTSFSTGVLHNADFWNYDNLSAAEQDEFNWNAMGTSTDRYDTQLDLYQYSFLGYSGRFVVVKESGQLVAKFLSQEQKVDIEISANADFEITAFVLTDPNGLRYSFDVPESTVSTTFTGTVLQGEGEGNISYPGPGSVYSNTSAWHLSSVKTSNDQSLLDIIYEASPEAYTSSASTTKNELLSIGDESGAFNSSYLENSYNKTVLKPKKQVNYFSIQVGTKKIKELIFSDGTKVVFNGVSGHPETGGNKLDEIILKDRNGMTYKSYSLNYQTVNDRLWFTKLTEKADDVSFDYVLNYYKKDELPPFNSASDTWGYNELSSLSPPVEDIPQDFDPEAIKKGVLSSIVYPTGGVKEFIFEHNTFSYGAGAELTEDLLLTNPANFDRLDFDINLSGNYDLSANNGEFYSQTVSFTHDQKVYIDINNLTMKDNMTGNYEPVDNMVMKIVDAQDNEVASLQMEENAFTTMEVPEGNYFLKLIALNLGTFEINGNIKVYYADKHETLLQYLYGGGLRIKEIRFKDTEASPNYLRRFEYAYQDASNPLESSGAVDGLLGNLSNDYEFYHYRLLYSTPDEFCNDLTSTKVRYRITTKGPNAQLTKGGYVGYKNVEVAEVGNGKTVYTYTSPEDYHASPTTFQFPFPPTPNIDFKRGLLTKKEVFNEAGDPLLKEENMTYNFNEETIAPSLKVVDLETCLYAIYYDTYDHYQTKFASKFVPTDAWQAECPQIDFNCGTAITHLAAFEDDLTLGRAQLVEKVRTEYFYDAQGQHSTQITEEYTYNTENFQVSETTKSWEENGVTQEQKTELFYPVGGYPTADYTTAEQNVITRLQALNKVAEPIYSKTFKDGQLIASVQNIYEEFHTDLVEKSVVRAAKGSEPLEVKINYHAYDVMGNPLEVSKENDIKIAYLWGYDNTVPVAKVENASYATISGLVNPSTLDNPSSETALINELDQLRVPGLDEANVSTFTYKSHLGLSTAVDPNGLKKEYHYDNRSRLKFIKDHDENIIKEFNYHYSLEY